ncbi:hypothetical protein [Ancylobacter terrae]|uniref:hypothetical protein n=1 Tax=Ancylobacter sp. sgz301288 TaxID=3342077 RepID=UPI003860059C
MPVNLLALCKPGSDFIVKRVMTTAEVQGQLEGIFIQQEQTFLNGVSEEVVFDGGWSPEPNELLYAPITPEATSIFQAAQGNIVAMPQVNATAFENEGIRALAVLVQRPAGPRLLLQEFSARQLLERRFNLILDGDTFNRLTQPAFSLGASLAGMIDGDRIKFRLFNRIKLIFDLTNLYQEATNAQLDTFCALPSLQIADAAAFKSMADQKMRKLINAISERNTLGNYTPAQIAEAADTEGFQVEIIADRIVMPSTKSNAKALLHFLDNGLYRAALGGEMFITNSKRIYQAST